MSRYKLAQTSAAPRGGGCPRTPACALSLFFSPGHRVKSRADKGRPWTSLAKIKAFHKGPPPHLGTAGKTDGQRGLQLSPQEFKFRMLRCVCEALSASLAPSRRYARCSDTNNYMEWCARGHREAVRFTIRIEGGVRGAAPRSPLQKLLQEYWPTQLCRACT